MTALRSITSFMGRVIEIRLRAFAYALCIVVGILIGLWIHQAMAAVAIRQVVEGINAKIVEHRS